MEEVEQGSSRSTLQQVIVINLHHKFDHHGDVYDDDDYNHDNGGLHDDYKGDEGEQCKADEDDDKPGTAPLWIWRVQAKTNSV